MTLNNTGNTATENTTVNDTTTSQCGAMEPTLSSSQNPHSSPTIMANTKHVTMIFVDFCAIFVHSEISSFCLFRSFKSSWNNLKLDLDSPRNRKN